MLTKQLQVLIDVSLSAGRSFDDVRTILKLQGFSDDTIDGLFEAYRTRSPAKQGMVATPLPAVPVASATSVPPESTVSVPQATPAAPVKTYEAPVIMPHHDAPAPAPAAVPAPTPTPASQDTTYAAAPGVPSSSQAMRIDVAPDFVPSATVAADTAMPPYESVAPRPVSTTPVAGSINVGIAAVPELEQAALEEYQRKLDKSPAILIITLVVVLALIGGFAYWFFTTGPGGFTSEQTLTVDDVRNATPTVEEITPLSNIPEDIDPFTGAPRLPDNATITPVTVPTTTLPTVQTCGPFKNDLSLDATGPEVAEVQRYFASINLFTIFAEQAKIDGTYPSFTTTPGVYDQQMRAAVRFYQTVMFAGDRALTNIAWGTLDLPTREVMFADCDGAKFNRYYTDVVHTERDVKIKSVLGSIRISVFDYFDTAATFDGLCTKSQSVTTALDELSLLTRELGGPVCRSTNSDWIIAAPLYGSTGLWCIDSFKNSLEVPSLNNTQLKCR